MRVLKVEFVARRQVPTWLWAILSIAVTLLAAQQALEAWTLQQQLRLAEGEAAALSAQLDRAKQAERDAASQRQLAPPYARDAAAIAHMAGFPWDRVLTSIEQTQVLGVRVTSLEITASDGSVKVELEFTNHEALMSYLEGLNAGEERARWQLIQAQSPTATGGTATIGSSWSEADR